MIVLCFQPLAFEPLRVNKYMVRVIIIGCVLAFEIFLHAPENLKIANAREFVKVRKLRKRVSFQSTQIRGLIWQRRVSRAVQKLTR
jgi:hypothetical protein